MPKTELGELESVPINAAWENEPQDFTPWLYANLDKLSRSLGVKLSDPEMEVKTDKLGSDRFSADIVATTADGDVALIENQLTGSDHGHLGQIMTYLAGVEAKMVIWIAPSFRESHLSAIRWLNSHTIDEISFFAVALKVVRIGDSPLAPLFDVVERPNDWERQVAEKQREVLSPTLSEKRRFWNKYIELYPHAKDDMGAGGHGSTRWRSIPNSDLVVSRWVSKDGVGMFVRGGRKMGNSPYNDLLPEQRERLIKRLEASADDGGYPLYKWFDGPFSDEADWPVAIHWLEKQTNDYVAAIQDETSGSAV